MKSREKLVLAAHEKLRRSPTLKLFEWTVLNRRLLQRGRPFDIKDHKYLEGIYRDESQQIVVEKAGQTGVSEYCISWVLWSADERGCTGLYVFPTDTTVNDFSSARFGPALDIEVSPYLASLVQGTDKVGLKRVGDRFVYFRGARIGADGRAPQLRSVDADVLVLDELDEFPVAAPAIARERLGHSRIGDVREVSTPTYPDIGINARYNASDQCKWMVKCPSCSRFQDMTIYDVVIEWDDNNRPAAWRSNAQGHAYVACRHCNNELDRGAEGVWVPTFPDRKLRGFHISRLFVPFKSVDEIIQGLRSFDEAERQQTYNQALGLPYVSSSSARLTDATLTAARRAYSLKPSSTGGNTVMGVDVGRALHVVIREFNRELGAWDLLFADTRETFYEVSDLMLQYRVAKCVVDALPETRVARDFQDTFPKGVVWLAYFDTHGVGVKRRTIEKWDHAERKVHLDRTRILDRVIGGILIAATGEDKGALTLPGSAREMEMYWAHLKAVQRVLKEAADGQAYATHVSSGMDHFMFAEVYCMAGALSYEKYTPLADPRAMITSTRGSSRADPNPWSLEIQRERVPTSAWN